MYGIPPAWKAQAKSSKNVQAAEDAATKANIAATNANNAATAAQQETDTARLEARGYKDELAKLINSRSQEIIGREKVKTAGFNILYNGHRFYPSGFPTGSFWESNRAYQFLVHIVNGGPYPADKVLYGADVEIVEDVQGKPNVEEAWNRSKPKWWEKNKDHSLETWAVTDSATAFGNSKELSVEDLSGLGTEHLHMFVLAAVQWDDDAGRHQLDYCVYANSHISVNFPHNECNAHNFVIHKLKKETRQLD
jgi:hypothetical protein